MVVLSVATFVVGLAVEKETLTEAVDCAEVAPVEAELATGEGKLGRELVEGIVIFSVGPVRVESSCMVEVTIGTVV